MRALLLSLQRDFEAGLSKGIGGDATVLFNELIPPDRHGHPEEIARCVLFLACARSSFTMGAMLMFDGGMGV